jgi:hypothetical protein
VAVRDARKRAAAETSLGCCSARRERPRRRRTAEKRTLRAYKSENATSVSNL